MNISNFILYLSKLRTVFDVTLGTSDLWLGTRTGAGGTATLAQNFHLSAAYSSMDNRPTPIEALTQ